MKRLFYFILLSLIITTINNALYAQCSVEITSNQSPSIPNTVGFGVYVALLDSSSLSTMSFTWDFGDGTTSNEAFTSHTYSNDGEYVVCVTLVTASGCTAIDCNNLYVGIIPPPYCNSSFSYFSTGSGNYQFTAAEIDESIEYQWSFGDGTSATGANATHAFTDGYYNVCLTVNTNDGCTNTSCQDFAIVINPIDTLACSASFTWQLNSDGVMTANSTSFAAAPITALLWDFGDGTSSNGPDVLHTYNAWGPFEVCLTLMSGTPGTTDFCTDQTCQTVGGGSSEICAASYYFINDPSLGGLQFYDQSFSTNPITSWNWQLSNGTVFNEPNPLYTSTFDSPLNVCLTIESGQIGMENYCTNTFCSIIFPTNDTLIFPDFCAASFNATPSAFNPLNYQFEGSNGVTDVSITDWLWNFGDGTTSTAQNPPHLFATANTYNVCLTINTVLPDGTACSNTFCNLVNAGQTLGPICGTIAASDNPSGGFFPPFSDFMTVYLIQYNPIDNTLTAIDSISLTPAQQGYFCFDSLPSNLPYLIKAAMQPASAEYANYMPTYYASSLTWDMAAPVIPGNGIIQLVMMAGTNPGGPGFIGGNISDGAGIISSSGVANATIIVLNNDNTPVAYTYTDADGNYTLPNLPYGTYTINVDLLNYTTTPFSVTLSPENPTAPQVNFVINGTELTIDTPLAGSVVEELVEPDIIILLPSVVTEWTIAHVNSPISTSNGALYVHNAIGAVVQSRRIILTEGNNNAFWINAIGFAPGQYTVSIIANGSLLGSARFLKL